MNHSVLAGLELDKGSYRDYSYNLAVVDLADFGLEDYVLYLVLGKSACLDVCRRYKDAAVVFDIYAAAGFSNETLNYLAARTDDFANLIGIYLIIIILGAVLKFGEAGITVSMASSVFEFWPRLFQSFLTIAYFSPSFLRSI